MPSIGIDWQCSGGAGCSSISNERAVISPMPSFFCPSTREAIKNLLAAARSADYTTTYKKSDWRRSPPFPLAVQSGLDETGEFSLLSIYISGPNSCNQETMRRRRATGYRTAFWVLSY